jgi:hypothetical protein
MAVERGPNELLKLHTRDVEGRLGGHKWSKSFASYIGSMRPTSLEAHKQSWWRSAYVLSRLRRDAAVTQTVLTAFLAFHYQDDLDWEDVATTYGVTKAQFGALDRYARRVYMH